MNGSIIGRTVAIPAAAHPREPLLQRLANRIFRCSHRRKSHALTPRGETERYAVCLDCGARLVSNLPALSAGASPHQVPRTALRMGLMAVGLAGVSFFWANRRPATIRRASWQIVSLLEPAGVAQFSAGRIVRSGRMAPVPEPSRKPEYIVAGPIGRNPPAPSPARRVHSASRLESRGSVVVLGRDPAAALELAHHPAALSTLIQSGALFAVSRGTAIKICRSNDRISQVQILEGSRSGQEGWVPSWQVATP